MAIPKKLWISAAVTAVKYSILAVIALHGEPSTNTGIVAKYAALALMDILIDAFKEIFIGRPPVHAAVAGEDAPAAVVGAAANASIATPRVAAANSAADRPPATYDNAEMNFVAGN